MAEGRDRHHPVKGESGRHLCLSGVMGKGTRFRTRKMFGWLHSTVHLWSLLARVERCRGHRRGEMEVEDRERSQLSGASVLADILELLSNQRVNVANRDHIRSVPVWYLGLMYQERNEVCGRGQLGRQRREHQSAGCAPRGFPSVLRFSLPRPSLPALLQPRGHACPGT